MHQTASRLRSVLLEFYPQALQAFPKLTHRAALSILAVVSTPSQGRRITRSRIVGLLHRCGRRNDPSLVEQIFTDLHEPALRQPARVEEALGLTVRGLIDVLIAMAKSVDDLQAELSREFDQHALAPILRSAPGLGPVLAARVLAEVGDDPTRFTSANGLRAFAGTAPITRASGRSHYVRPARSVTNASATPVIGGRSRRSPNHRAPGRITTNAAPPVITTTPRCATWPTSCLADSGGASHTTRHGTKPPPGLTPAHGPIRWLLDV